MSKEDEMRERVPDLVDSDGPDVNEICRHPSGVSELYRLSMFFEWLEMIETRRICRN